MKEKCENCHVSVLVEAEFWEFINENDMEYVDQQDYGFKFCPECGTKIDWSKID